MKKLFTCLLFFVSIYSIAQSYGFRRIDKSDNYRGIILNHSNAGSADLIHFPLFFSGTYPWLANANNGGKVKDPNGYDITFSKDSANNFPIKFDLETYFGATGYVAFWIRIDTFHHLKDDTIYIHYNNYTINTFQGDRAKTWDTYGDVWKMNETITANSQTLADATIAHQSLTTTGATTWTSSQQQIGKCGGALQLANPDLNSSGQYLTFNSLTVSTNYTIEFWVNLSLLTQASIAFGNATVANDINWFSATARIFDGSGDELVSNIATPSYIWTHFAIVQSGTAQTIYQNGVAQGTSTNGNTSRVFNTIGYQTGTGPTASCIFDQISYAFLARSADWIAAEYNNQNSPSTFYTLLPEN